MTADFDNPNFESERTEEGTEKEKEKPAEKDAEDAEKDAEDAEKPAEDAEKPATDGLRAIERLFVNVYAPFGAFGRR